MAEVIRPAVENVLELVDNVALDLVPSEIHFAWVRWCYESINKHFNDRKESYAVYIEGDERTTQDNAEFAELRIDGPFIGILQKHLYYLDVEINILCQTHVDPKNHYKAQIMVGTFLRAFRNIIPVYKFGNGPLDDGSLLECFHLQRSRKEKIDIGHFGIIRPDTKILQTTIEGHYRLELWTKGD